MVHWPAGFAAGKNGFDQNRLKIEPSISIRTHQRLLAARDARAEAVDEGGGPPAGLRGRQRMDHVGLDRRQRVWRIEAKLGRNKSHKRN